MDESFVHAIRSLIIGVIAIMVIYVIGSYVLNKVEENLLPDIDRTNYTIYIDGAEVDADNIDLSLYSVTYDDNNKKIYATSRRGFFWVFLPQL